MRRTPLLALLALAGCGGGAQPAREPERGAAKPAGAKPATRLRIQHARCPAGASNCAAATGRVVYVEAHDPDGDGDLHLVVLGGGVTFPGVTVFDIEQRLRPRRVPRPGDLASAAGPVYRGSYGQRQIQATEFHVAYR